MKSYSLSYKIIRGLLFVVQCKQQDCKKVAKIKSFLKWSSARFSESSNSLPSGNNVPLIVSHKGGMHRMNQFLLVRFISLYHQRFRQSQFGMWTRNVNNVKLIKQWAAFKRCNSSAVAADARLACPLNAGVDQNRKTESSSRQPTGTVLDIVPNWRIE